ncbi:MAG: DUF4260 domain-containing protein [Myxococcales bacterium]|nr:DUF4260 domain-containing protein [Myxococcales bacterium]
MTTDTLTRPATSDTTTAIVIPRGAPQLLLRLEGAIVLAGALVAYAHQGGGWGVFAALFLVPDLSLLGYLAGPRIGAAVYNAGHSHAVPATLAAIAWLVGSPALLLGATIWVAHIGFDRMLGYGLKYASGFRDTHLGRVGHAPEA